MGGARRHVLRNVGVGVGVGEWSSEEATVPPDKAEAGGKEGATQIWHLASRREPGRRGGVWTGGTLLACFLPAVNSQFSK